VTSLAGCLHGDADHPLPCPPMCPVQQWPHYLFRLRWVRDGYVLRRKHRHLIDEWNQRRMDESNAWLLAQMRKP
jgi:hypothetical protein